MVEPLQRPVGGQPRIAKPRRGVEVAFCTDTQRPMPGQCSIDQVSVSEIRVYLEDRPDHWRYFELRNKLKLQTKNIVRGKRAKFSEN